MSDLIERIAGLSPQKRELLLQRLNHKKESVSLAKILPQSRDSNTFPLSFAQQRLWFFEQLNPGNFTYHIVAGVRLTGTLDARSLDRSLNELVKRHEVLRTAFKTINGQPIQAIASNLELKILEIDLRSLPETERSREVERLIAAEAKQAFDLSQAPLLRAKLLQLSDSNWVLLLSTHHIIFDAWSMGIFIQELATFYQAFCTGKPSPLPELSVQYADFASWQRQWLQGEVLETQLAYWKKQLGGNLPVLNLPTDRPRSAVQTFRGAVHKFTIPKAIAEEIVQLSQREKATLFMTLLAAFKTLLYRYTGQEDILVGSPIANRNRREIEELIGLFANTLVFRTNLSSNPTFKELLASVREVALGAYNHQDLPFEKLVEILHHERDLSHNPLFQVLFSLRNVRTPQIKLPGVMLSNLEIERKTARFDLALDLEEGLEGINGTLEYSEDLFDASTARRIAGHFITLLESIATNPEQRLSNLPILTKPEQQQLLFEWNNTQSNFPQDKCIHELFEAQAELTPDAIAVVFENEYLTYRDLNKKANNLASYLQKIGVNPEFLVGIYVDRSLDMVVGLLGILKAGGAYVPLDPAYPPERLAFMLEDAQISVLLTQQKLLETLPKNSASIVFLDADREGISSCDEPVVGLQNSSNLAYVIYTSGSTGQPKGVQISHASAVNFLSSMRQQLAIADRDVWLAVTSLSFDIAALELFLPITTGSRVVVASREVTSNGEKLLETLTNSGTTIMQATPASWKMLLAAGWPGNNQLKILCGGEALPRQLANQLLLRGAAVWNLYGPTETTIWSTLYQVDRKDESVSIGRPIANTQIFILDRYLMPVPVGVFGELHIGGAGLSRGYLNRPELTAEKFISNPFTKNEIYASFILNSSSFILSERLYKTGDLARYLPDGNIEFMGRSDHQVKVRGFRIELGEIEAVLSQYPAVREAIALVREDNPGDKRLVAYIVVNSALRGGQGDTAPTNSEFINHLRVFLKQKLPQYMIPSAFVLLEAMPLTPNGKIDRRSLRAPDTNTAEFESNFTDPRTPEEQLIAEIWAEVLGLERVGIHDNFFELGGHSLLATQAIARLREAFQVEVPLRSLFESPTVATVTESLLQYRAEQTLKAPPIDRASREGELPLSFAQQRLWFVDQLQPGDPAYNIPAAVRLKGAIDVTALQRSFQTIIDRHEALRTIFNTVEGRSIQTIISSPTFALSVIDLQEFPHSQRETEAMRLALEEARQPFDLAKWPLMRVTLLQLNETESILLLTIHHIVADGWSLGVIVREMAALYEAFCAGKASPLSELPLQYVDYAVWQRNWLSGEVLETKLAYWKQHLGNPLPVLQLPTKQPRSNVSTYRAALQPFQLSPTLSQALNKLSRQENATLFMTMLAALETLLYRYTNQDDIIVGTDLANRTQIETEALIGFFVNILVLRTDLSGNPTFCELLARVREVTLKAYAHQDLPFDKLVEELRPDRSLNQTPIFQVLFVMQNMPMPALKLGNLTLTPIEVDSEIAKFDLVLFVGETERGIAGSWKYNAGLFDCATIEQMSNRFETLLSSIVAQPETRLKNLEILTEAEKQKQTMQELKREKLNFSKFKSIKPKEVALPEGELIKTELLQPGELFPLVIKPAINNVDLADWAKNNRELIEAKLLQHGAILFRGFIEPVVSAFEQFAHAICPELFGEYGDLPREGVSPKVYGSTPYPADQAILFHSESSHLHRWPMKIWFFCVQPAQQGGETPIVDCRKIYQLLDPKLREKFAQKQIMYVRNYTDGLDVSWKDFFKTEDKSVVEEYCRQAGMKFEWKAGNNLRTRKIRPAIAKHQKTGEMVFFNQLPLHHISCLDAATRASLLSVFGEENLPRNVYYGDGTPIEDSVMEEIQAVYAQAAVSFPWQAGDILMLDNMLVAHSRNPFIGSRKIVVAMGEMIPELGI
ncbi:non-ribosomal peptide synthetase [Tychonema sp. LEGE 06208]|uniref:non-ribosomal peptide synthetase n=1 Tax=Tychonema sp. LEGE 06208 TaxID=1828663 RepID=UPI00187F1674|nr:non-ribosomal peptide synthetase [Tychonema sp. LEGE 06208]MBE9162160.1 amino acid adenylation domain-containing protein [Tychonema sp. LEGE 06208]